MVDPEQAATGAAIGGALPGVVKAAGYAGQKLGQLGGSAIKGTLGLTTGAGGESISQAFRAGKTGNRDFVRNMRGDVSMTDVLDDAKQGLAAMRTAKAAQYRSGMVPIASDKTVLQFTAIDDALNDAAAITTFKGQVKSEKAADAVARLRDSVDQWRALDPTEFHTPEGLDALKQKLGAIIEAIPFEEKTARLAAGKVYAATKSSIENQAPAYAKVMQDYSSASDLIKEIERALSLSNKASADTAMRKLQSLMRNNVQTNYGNRLDLAGLLEGQGGVSLLPSIAGQALNSATPRSLAGQIGGGATAFAAMANPLALAALPIQSPRIVGEMVYSAGRMAGGASRATNNALARAIQANPQAAALGQSPNVLSQLGYRVAPLAAIDR